MRPSYITVSAVTVNLPSSLIPISLVHIVINYNITSASEPSEKCRTEKAI